MRAAAGAALLMLGGLMSACSPSGGSTAAGGGAAADKFAGLETEIPKWKSEIVAADPLCKSQAEGEKCNGFEVACKAERTVTADDTAKGITARVVAAMTFSGFDPKFQHAQSGLRVVEFAKAPAGWTRTDHKPVSPATCADL